MHYLDPASLSASADDAPAEQVASTSSTDDVPELPDVLLKYEQYVASGGSRGFSEWCVSCKHLDGEVANQIQLPRRIQTDQRLRASRTPIRDVLTSARYDEKDAEMVRAAITTLRNISPAGTGVGEHTHTNPKSKRRLDFSTPPREDDADDTEVVAMELELLEAPASSGISGMGWQVMTRLERPPRMKLAETFWGYTPIVEFTDIHDASTHWRALLCEIIMLGAVYDVPISEHTRVVANSRASLNTNANVSAQRQYDGRSALALASRYCERPGAAMATRDLAAAVVALRSPFREAAMDYLFGATNDSAASALAWIGSLPVRATAYPTPVWMNAHVSKDRKEFTPPYVDAGDLGDAAYAMRVLAKDRGGGIAAVADAHAEVLWRVMNYVSSVASKLDAQTLASAHKELERPDTWANARVKILRSADVMDAVTEYVCDHIEVIDSYVSHETIYFAFRLGGGSNNPNGGWRDKWVELVNVAVRIQHEFATSRVLAFDVQRYTLLTPRDVTYVASPKELAEVYGVAATCESVEALESIADEVMGGGEWMAENARPVYVAGLVLCAVQDVLWKTRGKLPVKHSLRSSIRNDVAAVVACMKHVSITRGTENMEEFLRRVALNAVSSGVEYAFQAVWRTLLPYFAEATLYCRAKDAPGATDIDVRAGITTWIPASALGSVLGSPRFGV